MRRIPKRGGITRLSESTETRESVRQNAPEYKYESGKFCTSCNKWFPHLKQAKAVCNACTYRLKAIYGTNGED